MKKITKIFTASLLAATMLSLTACNSSGGNASSNSSSKPVSSSSADAVSSASEQLKGKTITIAHAKLMVPEGWLAITPNGASDKTDDFSETQVIKIYKGAKDATDYRHPNIGVECVNTTMTVDEFKKNTGLSDIKDSADLVVDGRTFKTFTGKSSDTEYICGYTEIDKFGVNFVLMTSYGEEKASLDEEPIFAILGSLTPTK